MKGGLKTLCADLGVGERTVYRALKELRDGGFVRVQQRGRGMTPVIFVSPDTTGRAEASSPDTRDSPSPDTTGREEKKRGEKKEPPNPPSQGGRWIRFSDRDRKIVSKAWAVPGMYGDTRSAWRALDEAGRSEDKLKAAFAWWADNPGTQLPGKVVA